MTGDPTRRCLVEEGPAATVPVARRLIRVNDVVIMRVEIFVAELAAAQDHSAAGIYIRLRRYEPDVYTRQAFGRAESEEVVVGDVGVVAAFAKFDMNPVRQK
ncbi:hypothetical protein A5642_22465 [Mycolicibacterium mucogenicum]|uniref:Uncharacterized protein n=1 Tax=Mycolicibacterium mucogenicum TaxID=56689 RepID=A0A1A0MN57_MYCMU|nr:hypothetical protein A5642_22465 [Mycolicibacterium mucogenicum]